MKAEDIKKAISAAKDMPGKLEFTKNKALKSLDRISAEIMNLSEIRLFLEEKSSRLTSDKIIIYNEGLEKYADRTTLKEREQAAQSSDEYLDIRQDWEDTKALIKHATTIIDSLDSIRKIRAGNV